MPSFLRLFLLVRTTDRDQTDLHTTQFDLKVAARLHIEHGVYFTDHQGAVELNLGGIEELPAALTDFFTTTTAKVTSHGI